MNKNNPFGSGIIRNILSTYKRTETKKSKERQEETFYEKKHKDEELRLIRKSINVNVWLGIVSIVVLGITGYQAYLSRKAVNIANDALSQQKRIDSANSKSDADKFKLQKESVNAQIEALNAARDQFDREHDNFLDVDNMMVDFSNVAKEPRVMYTLVNYGSTIRIEKSKFSIGHGARQDSLKIIKSALSLLKGKKFDLTPTYIGQQTPKNHHVTIPTKNLQSFKKMTNDSFIIFFCGEVEYRSLINKKSMLMSFILSTNVINISGYQILSIKNEEIKKHK